VTVLANATKRKTDIAPSELSKSTLWRRAYGRPSGRKKAASQQYLSPREENALVDYFLRMSERDYPLPVKFLRSLALVIARQRSSAFQIPAAGDRVRPPGKNWPQAFYERHPELKSKRVRALDWVRHDHNVYDKVVQWFTVIGKELNDPAIIVENVYNMDETCRDDGGGGKGTGMHESQFAVVCLLCAVIGQEHGELRADFTDLGEPSE
jgi:hypothetical protein